MLLKGLARKDLGEQISGVVVGGHVLDRDQRRAAHLAHLEEFTIDVSRVLRRSETVTEVMGALVVGVSGLVSTPYESSLLRLGLRSVRVHDGVSCGIPTAS